MLIAALGVGISSGCFTVAVASVSRWYPREKKGIALGMFGCIATAPQTATVAGAAKRIPPKLPLLE